MTAMKSPSDSGDEVMDNTFRYKDPEARRFSVHANLSNTEWMTTREVAEKINARCPNPDYVDTEAVGVVLNQLARYGYVEREPPAPQGRGMEIKWRLLKYME